MKGREPWFGLLTAVGLAVMLVGEGYLDALGLGLALAPLVHAAVAALRAG